MFSDRGGSRVYRRHWGVYDRSGTLRTRDHNSRAADENSYILASMSARGVGLGRATLKLFRGRAFLLCNRDERASTAVASGERYDKLSTTGRATHLSSARTGVHADERAQCSSRSRCQRCAHAEGVLRDKTHDHASLVVTSRKPRRGKKKNSRAGIRLGYRDEYLSQTKSAAAQTVRPARRGRTGIFEKGAHPSIPRGAAARVYRPAPDPKTRRSRRRPSCPWGGTS